ncbi:MAG: hypothetical protein WAM70_14750 [Pyrinomonadaceae bacterium]
MKPNILEPGLKPLALKRRAEPNLTFEQEVVKDFSGLDSLPGFVLVIFERRDLGGAVFSRLVNSGERFRSRFSISRRDLWKKYFAIAVNDSVLNYTFEQSIVLDDGSEEFTLLFQLSFRVADPRKVAEMREHDPLLKLRGEVARVITRNCAKRKAEMFNSRFRELERIVIDTESAWLRTYAADLGFKIISIDLDKPPVQNYQREVIQQENKRRWEKHSHEIQQDINRTKQKALPESEHQREEEDVDHNYDVQRSEVQRQIELNSELDELHRAQQSRKLREFQTDAIGQALTNVGAGIDTPDNLREGFEVAREIAGNTQTNQRARPSSIEERPEEGHSAERGIQTDSNLENHQSTSEPGPAADVDQSALRDSWKSEAAVLVKLLDDAGADSAVIGRLREELGAIEASVFSVPKTSDAVVTRTSDAVVSDLPQDELDSVISRK